MTEFKIPIRIEDLSPLATRLINVMKSNLGDFTAFSPEFTVPYTVAVEDKIKDVDTLVSTKLFIGEIVKITQKLHENMMNTRPALLQVEGYVIRAKNQLSVPVKSFGFSGVRKSITNLDAEGFCSKLTILLQMVKVNKAVLEAKGLKPETINLLNDTIITNNKIIKEHNDKIIAKEKAVAENKTVLYSLWKECQNIMDAGKRIYKYSKPEMVKNFTRSYILKTMRHNVRHTSESGEMKPVNA
jgi:hypothetical protein